MTRLFSACAMALACLFAVLTAPPAGATDADHNPVIFIHGFGGSSSDVSMIKPGLVERGYNSSEIYSLAFPNDIGNAAVAKRLATLVDQVLADTGAAEVDLIGFSMGSLSSRYYVKNLGGGPKVEHYASIAGPNHGTSQAYWAWVFGVYPQSEMYGGSTFLRNLNATDETPGSVAYATWYSSCDGTIDPYTSTALSGATNHKTAACVKHNSLPSHPEVIDGIVAHFAS